MIINIAGIFGLGSLVTIISTYWLNERARRKQDEIVRKHLALRLAIIFENYAYECAELLNQHDLADEYHEIEFIKMGNMALHNPDNKRAYVGKWISEVPRLPSLPAPDDTRYDLLSPDLLNEIYDFPTRCIMANRAAEFYRDVAGDRDAWMNSCKMETIKMGMHALTIGDKLRDRYELGSRLLKYDQWDMRKTLEEESANVKEHEERMKHEQTSPIPT